MKLNYEAYSNYALPCLTLDNDSKHYELGVFANRHRRYLKDHPRIIYYNLLTSNNLYSYLNDIEIRAQAHYQELIKFLSEKENITEKLKANDSLLYVQRMNNIKNRALEIINQEIIYNY